MLSGSKMLPSPADSSLKKRPFADVQFFPLYIKNCTNEHCAASKENKINSLVLLALNGVKELLKFLSGEDPVGKVGVELFERQLAVI